MGSMREGWHVCKGLAGQCTCVFAQVYTAGLEMSLVSP